MKNEEAMNNISRKLLTITAAGSLVALTACGGSGVEDPPALSDIDDLMWETVQEQESVTISADMSQLMGTLDDGSNMFGGMFGPDGDSVKIYGDLDGTSMAVALGEDDLMRVFGQDAAYLSGDAIFSIFGGEGLTEQEVFEGITEEFADTWIDFSNELDDEEFNIGTLLSELQDSWAEGDDSDETPITRDEISDEGIHEVRDEQDVWVYEGAEDGQELVIEANHDAPIIVAISDGDNTMTFSDWNETESPERPEESQIIDEDEFEQRMMEIMLGSGSL